MLFVYHQKMMIFEKSVLIIYPTTLSRLSSEPFALVRW